MITWTHGHQRSAPKSFGKASMSSHLYRPIIVHWGGGSIKSCSLFYPHPSPLLLGATICICWSQRLHQFWVQKDTSARSHPFSLSVISRPTRRDLVCWDTSFFLWEQMNRKLLDLWSFDNKQNNLTDDAMQICEASLLLLMSPPWH